MCWQISEDYSLTTVTFPSTLFPWWPPTNCTALYTAPMLDYTSAACTALLHISAFLLSSVTGALPTLYLLVAATLLPNNLNIVHMTKSRVTLGFYFINVYLVGLTGTSTRFRSLTLKNNN